VETLTLSYLNALEGQVVVERVSVVGMAGLEPTEMTALANIKTTKQRTVRMELNPVRQAVVGADQ
jgi:hypothetical protein